MARRGKSRLYGKAKGRESYPIEELVETVIVDVDDLDFDTLNIESRQQYIHNVSTGEHKKVTFYRPTSNILINGKTVSLQGDDFLDFFMNISGMLGDTTGMKGDEIKSARKEVHNLIIQDFYRYDWEDVIERYKKQMKSRDISMLRLRVDNSRFHSVIIDVQALKRDDVDTKKIVDWLSEVTSKEGVFKNITLNDLIVSEAIDRDYVIKSGFKLQDVDDGISILPFISINDETFEFDGSVIHRTELWENDVIDAISKDIDYMDDMANNVIINSRRSLKGVDEKFIKGINKKFKQQIYRGRHRDVIPKGLIDDIVISFDRNLNKYCLSDEFGDSYVCVDLALNRTIRSFHLNQRANKKMRDLVLHISGDI